ncbi:MAG TPA: sorbosone dehydrogenase family protein, partial [Nostocaceae cyanobacterium]|nr:sorbosone dehydrogenase family protein [Nostocaceae cyanobacterium]
MTLSERFWLPVLLIVLVGCSRTEGAGNTLSAQEIAQNSAPSQNQNIIPTTPLTPQPIRINLKNLPSPFTTDSASKPPQIAPIPQNPLLNVPTGFQVNIFAEGLEAPRWLALTPNGDVLVTETRKNQIRLLRDTNRDGVADVKQTFANEKNGLNIPFGMAFTDNYFFVGNTDEVLRFSYQKGQQQITGKGQRITELPGGGYNQHWTRNVVVAPD